MNYIFLAFAGLCLILLAMAIARPQRTYEYPYFMAMAFTGFILPQAWGLDASKSVPDEWLNLVFLNCFLCLACCWAGYSLRPRERWIEGLMIEINPEKFSVAGIILIAIGYFFDHLIGGMSQSDRGGSQWTGAVTIYLFFANQVITGFAICLYCALEYRKRIYWILAGIGAMSPIIAVIYYGRRESAALLILTTAMVFFFTRKVTPPRAVVIGLLVGGTVLIPATEQYRQNVRYGTQFEVLTQIDYGALLKQYANVDSTSELKNAMYMIVGTNASGAYGYGSDYWNRIIFAFVPAQIVTKTVKDALMIGDPEKQETGASVETATGYVAPVGSTITCVGDTFQQFWFFGGLFYAAVGIFFRHMWLAVTGADNPVVRIFYIQAMVGTMRSVSHGSGELLPAMIYSAIFLFLVTLYSRVRVKAQ